MLFHEYLSAYSGNSFSRVLLFLSLPVFPRLLFPALVSLPGAFVELSGGCGSRSFRLVRDAVRRFARFESRRVPNLLFAMPLGFALAVGLAG